LVYCASRRRPDIVSSHVTGELLLAAVVVGLGTGWLVGVVVGRCAYGLLGDLSLGLMGGTIAVWIYQAVGLVADAGTIGAMIAALMGAVGTVLAERRLRYYLGI
jgi:uncharacterized membrane protein YeaQ/YmgE (transglycosylase-associated protein family)